MPSDETLKTMRDAITRGLQAATVAKQEIARLRVAGLNEQAAQLERDLAAEEAKLQQLKRAYNL